MASTPAQDPPRGPVLLLTEEFSQSNEDITCSLKANFRTRIAKSLRGADFLLPVPSKGTSIVVKYLPHTPKWEDIDLKKLSKSYKSFFVMVPQACLSDPKFYDEFQLSMPENGGIVCTSGTSEGVSDLLLQLQKLAQPEKADIVRKYWQQQVDKCFSQSWIAKSISSQIPEFDGDEKTISYLLDIVGKRMVGTNKTVVLDSEGDAHFTGSLAQLSVCSTDQLLNLDAPVSEAGAAQINDFFSLEYEADSESQ